MLTFSCRPGYIACGKMKAEVSKNYTLMILYNYFFVYPICCSFYHHGFAHVFKRWLLYVSLRNINRTPDRLLALRVGRRTFQFCLLRRADEPQDWRNSCPLLQPCSAEVLLVRCLCLAKLIFWVVRSALQFTCF